MSSIFLPVRSNVDWFENQASRIELERIIKASLVIYDSLAVEDLYYRCNIGQQGAVEMAIPGPAVQFERRQCDYISSGGDFFLGVGPDGSSTPTHTLIHDQSLRSLRIDFYPILYDAGIASERYIKWLNVGLNENDKKHVKEETQEILRESKDLAFLPANHFGREKHIQSLHYDSLLAFRLGLPFIVSPSAAPLIEWENQRLAKNMQADLGYTFFNAWLSLGLPDLSRLSWEQIHDIRESAAGKDLRRVVEKVVTIANLAHFSIDDQLELENLMKQHITQELIEEAFKRRMDPKNAAMNLALNLIPLGIVAATGKDLYALLQEHRSWVSLLR